MNSNLSLITGLVPCIGAWVSDRQAEEPKSTVGEVVSVRGAKEAPIVDILWRRHPQKSGQTSERLSDLGSGFKIGMQVEHIADLMGRPSLGMGVVAALRTLGGHDQVLVDFWESGSRLWLPFQQLRMARGVEQRFVQGLFGGEGDAEALRLRSLAYALEIWNENTGALSRFDIDPLPHQIHLVHRILSSGHLNWMIADDVGLGKTIEVGMLLAALRQRNQCRRILLITPPGLTVQWQEELAMKFGMDNFEVYGRDFEIADARLWKMHDRVIASVDRLKQDDKLELLMQSERWDLVVFDEAHRLSRRQYGLRHDASKRYNLAARLRTHSDYMLLLTATPHQGMSDKFTALLELCRPDLKNELHLLELNPEILADIVIRNRKDHVTDVDGNLIFKGKETHAIPVPVSDEAKAFDKELQDYLRRGEQAGAQIGGKQGRAIGFVLNVYRKLAASSAAAIHQALRRRRERLAREYEESTGESFALDDIDARYEGEYEEAQAPGAAKEFFAGEMALLEEMIEGAERLLEHDAKLQAFVEKMVSLIHAYDESEKILIFTEYRATQSYLQMALERRLGAGCVELIHGGQEHDERRSAIQRFEDTGRFLISTEAGGEGINLQRHCHILVNYDLPWNPMRLVQRIGRLYRYGQQKPVLVFNMHAPETLDGTIVNLLYQRLEQVVKDMATVSSEFRSGLEDEILGQMCELIDVEAILNNAGQNGVSRTEAEIEAAIEQARKATELQQDMFEHVAGYESDNTSGELVVEKEHLQAFIEGMFARLGVTELRTIHAGIVREIELPDELLHELPSWRKRERITFDRAWGTSRNDTRVIDLDSPLTRVLLSRAKDQKFGGLCAQVGKMSGEAMLVKILRWQNGLGARMRQEFVAFQLLSGGRAQRNSDEVARWLLKSAQDGNKEHDREKAGKLVSLGKVVSDKRFAEVSERGLHPENEQWIAAGWLGS